MPPSIISFENFDTHNTHVTANVMCENCKSPFLWNLFALTGILAQTNINGNGQSWSLLHNG